MKKGIMDADLLNAKVCKDWLKHYRKLVESNVR